MSKVQYWARYNVNFHSIMMDIWDALEEEVPDHYLRENSPHITIHPRFQFDEEDRETFKHYVYEIFPTTLSIRINGFYYYPNEHQPMVICLDIDTNVQFRSLQKRLVDKISREGGKNVLRTAPPHITVYKSKDTGSNYRNIPSNVNQIKTECRKIGDAKLPITVSETNLRIERAPSQ